MRSISNLWLIIIHVALGALATFFFSNAILAWLLGYAVYALHRIFTTRDRDNYAGIAAGYLVTFEVVNRMLKVSLPWEFGKLIVIAILIAGMVAQYRKNPFPNFALLYFICLLPSLLVLDLPDILEIKDELSFNLSGPFALALSVMYFYKRKLDKENLRRILFALSLGLITTMTAVLIRMPSLQDIQFYHVSNFSTSGGFGPNQVSIILGTCFLIMGIAWYIGINVTGIGLLDRWIGGIALLMAILTFSRGGAVGPAVVLFMCAIVMATNSSNPKQFIRAIWIVGLLGGIAGAGYIFVNNLTNDALTDRYESAGHTTAERSEFDEKLTIRGVNLSGRESIFLADMIVFAQSPILGVGPGGGMVARERIGGVYIADHTEQSRMLAEHGIYGLFALLILIIAPYKAFKSAPNVQSKLVTVAFTLFCFLTMTHAATRLGTPEFLYGLGFAVILPKLTNPLMKAKAA